jgi:hypothetical protein
MLAGGDREKRFLSLKDTFGEFFREQEEFVWETMSPSEA